jgi:hypothetical protein
MKIKLVSGTIPLMAEKNLFSKESVFFSSTKAESEGENNIISVGYGFVDSSLV